MPLTRTFNEFRGTARRVVEVTYQDAATLQSVHLKIKLGTDLGNLPKSVNSVAEARQLPGVIEAEARQKGEPHPVVVAKLAGRRGRRF